MSITPEQAIEMLKEGVQGKTFTEQVIGVITGLQAQVETLTSQIQQQQKSLLVAKKSQDADWLKSRAVTQTESGYVNPHPRYEQLSFDFGT